MAQWLETREQYQKAERVVGRLEDKMKGKLCECGHHRKHHVTTREGPHRGGCKKCGCACWVEAVATPEERARARDGIEHILIFEWGEEGKRQREQIRRERERAARGTSQPSFFVRDEGRSLPDPGVHAVSEDGLLRRQLQLLQARRAGGGSGQDVSREP